MSAGMLWITAGVILMAAGTGSFFISHIVISRWIRSFEKNQKNW